jgi:hypothetical protein
MSPKRCSSAAAINEGREVENQEMTVKCTLFDICALAVLLLAYYVVAGLAPEKPQEMVHYAPEDALIYGEQHGATTVAREFLASHFVAKLLERERDQKIKNSETVSEAVHFVLSARRWLAAVMTHPLTKDLDIDTLGLGLLPPSVTRQGSELKEDFLLDNLVVWLRTKETDAWGIDFAAMPLGQSGEQGPVSIQYGRHQIRRLVVGDTSISLVMLGATLALSANESHLRRCIDVYDGERPSLAEKSASWLQQKGKPWRQLFVDAVALTKVFGDAQAGNSFLQPIDTITFQEYLEQTSTHKHLQIAYDPQRIAPARARVLLPRSASPSSNMPVAVDAMLWLWSNSLPFSLFFPVDEAADAYSIDGDVHEGSEIIKEVVSEISNHLERESLVIAEANPSNSPVAVPLVVVATRLGHPQRLLARLTQLSNFYQLSLGAVDQETLRYWYWTQSPGEGFGFLFGVYRDLFFFSNSREVVDKLFSISNEAQRSLELTATNPFETSLTRFDNLLAFVNNREFFATLQRLTQILATLTAIKDRHLAAHYWELSDGLLRPLLEGWQKEDRHSLVGATLAAGKIEVEVFSQTEKKR